MSQRAVEALLGRLLTDVDFRRRFQGDAAAACAHESLDVTAREMQAVSLLPESDLDQCARRLDPRIVRASLAYVASAGQKPRTHTAVVAAKARAVK